MHGHRDLREHCLHVQRLPVHVVVRVRQPVVVELRAAPDQLLHRVQRQVPLHLVVVDRVQTVDGVRARVLHDARLLAHRAPPKLNDSRHAPFSVIQS